MLIDNIRKLISPSGELRMQLIRTSLGSIGVKLIYILIQFVIGIMLARMLGPTALGIFTFIMALVHLLVIVAQLGFPTFLIRVIAVALEQKRISEIKEWIIGATKIILSLSLVIVSCCSFWLWSTDTVFTGIPGLTIAIGLFMIPFMALTASTGGAIHGLGFVIHSQLPNMIARPLVLLSILAGFYYTGITLTPGSVLYANTFAAVVALIISGFILLRHFPKPTARLPPALGKLDMLQQSLPFLLLAGVQVLNHQTDVLMLGALASQDAVGHYRVAAQIADGLTVALYAISATISPQISRLHAQQDWLRLQRLVIYSHRAGTLVILPLAMAAAVFSSPLINLMFGAEYQVASQALTILALAKIPYSMFGFSGLVLSMSNLPRIAVWLTSLTVLLNVILNFILIPHYGIEGAAVATGVSQVVIAIAGVLYLQVKEGIGISFFHKAR